MLSRGNTPSICTSASMDWASRRELLVPWSPSENLQASRWEPKMFVSTSTWTRLSGPTELKMCHTASVFASLDVEMTMKTLRKSSILMCLMSLWRHSKVKLIFCHLFLYHPTGSLCRKLGQMCDMIYLWLHSELWFPVAHNFSCTLCSVADFQLPLPARGWNCGFFFQIENWTHSYLWRALKLETKTLLMI